jgi:hypothetical protein
VKLLFSRLAAEDASLRLCITEALSLLAEAYVGATVDAVRRDLSQFLCDQAAVGDWPARTVALDWLRRVYPFSDVPARMACVALSSDARGEIRSVALHGLNADGKGVVRPALLASRTSDSAATSGAGAGAGAGAGTGAAGGNSVVDDDADTGDRGRAVTATDSGREVEAVPGQARYPSFDAFMAYATDSPAGAIVDRDASLLPASRCRRLQPESIVAAVAFMERCLLASAAVAGEEPELWLLRHHRDAEAAGTPSALMRYVRFLEFGMAVDPSAPSAARAQEVMHVCMLWLCRRCYHALWRCVDGSLVAFLCGVCVWPLVRLPAKASRQCASLRRRCCLRCTAAVSTG